jgi:hypothetical protein
MTDHNPNSPESVNQTDQDELQEQGGPGKGGTRFRRSLVPMILLVLALAGLSYSGALGRGVSLVKTHFPGIMDNPWVSSAMRGFASAQDPEPLSPVFVKNNSEDIFSQAVLLSSLGQSPSEPSKVLFRAFSTPMRSERAQTGHQENQGVRFAENTEDARPEVRDTPVIPGADQSEPSGNPGNTQDSDLTEERSQQDDELAELLAKTAPKPVETHITKPAARPDSSEPEDRVPKIPKKRETVSPLSDPQGRDDPEPGREEEPEPKRAAPDAAEQSEQKGQGGLQIETRASKDLDEPEEDVEKPEKFKVPGSLRVSIKGYEGASAKWALMMVLDDSAAMGREMRPWRPDRMEAARDFVERIVERTPRGSKIAVRDFYCSPSRRNRRTRTSSLCLSHMLFDWAEPPYTALKERLDGINPVGRTNPCAAAAFTLKRDLPKLRELKPRVAILTSGMARCKAGEVLRVIDTVWAGRKPHVDVIGFGLNRRTARGYSLLAKRTDAIMLKISGPEDIDDAVVKYSKALDRRVTGSIQVKGDNTGFKVAPDEEITLAPGSYDIVLPDAKGLNLSERTISGVMIESGKTSKVRVKLHRGKVKYKTAVN